MMVIEVAATAKSYFRKLHGVGKHTFWKKYNTDFSIPDKEPNVSKAACGYYNQDNLSGSSDFRSL